MLTAQLLKDEFKRQKVKYKIFFLSTNINC